MELILGLSFLMIIIAIFVNWFIKNRAICKLKVQGVDLYPFSLDLYFSIFQLGIVGPEGK